MRHQLWKYIASFSIPLYVEYQDTGRYRSRSRPGTRVSNVRIALIASIAALTVALVTATVRTARITQLWLAMRRGRRNLEPASQPMAGVTSRQALTSHAN